MGKPQKNDDIRRTTRIIQIDEMLRGGSYEKIASLVRKFGVSQRTVERDFERLRDDLNAPLESSFKNIMKKLVDFLPDTVSVNSSFLNQDISFISDPLCFGARMAQRPDY